MDLDLAARKRKVPPGNSELTMPGQHRLAVFSFDNNNHLKLKDREWPKSRKKIYDEFTV